MDCWCKKLADHIWYQLERLGRGKDDIGGNCLTKKLYKLPRPQGSFGFRNFEIQETYKVWGRVLIAVQVGSVGCLINERRRSFTP